MVITSSKNIKLFVLIIGAEYVFCAVRTEVGHYLHELPSIRISWH
jgi:hypothetical protein